MLVLFQKITQYTRAGKWCWHIRCKLSVLRQFLRPYLDSGRKTAKTDYWCLP